MTLVDRLHQLADVVRVPAELGENERRRSAAPHDPLQGELDILRPHRVAGVERQSVANPQGDGSAVVAHGMALGDATGQRAGILRLERHDPVVDVGENLARSELERLARIEGDDVTDVLRHNEGVERSLRRSRRGGQGEETEQGDERARESVPGHAYRMYRNASALLLIDRTDCP